MEKDPVSLRNFIPWVKLVEQVRHMAPGSPVSRNLWEKGCRASAYSGGGCFDWSNVSFIWNDAGELQPPPLQTLAAFCPQSCGCDSWVGQNRLLDQYQGTCPLPGTSTCGGSAWTCLGWTDPSTGSEQLLCGLDRIRGDWSLEVDCPDVAPCIDQFRFHSAMKWTLIEMLGIDQAYGDAVVMDASASTSGYKHLTFI